MRPTITRENGTWIVRVNGTYHAACTTWERAWHRAQRVAQHPARTRAHHELDRAQAALNRMEANR